MAMQVLVEVAVGLGGLVLGFIGGGVFGGLKGKAVYAAMEGAYQKQVNDLQAQLQAVGKKL